MSEDTIYALSSGRLPAAIGIIRISGSGARFGLETFGVKLPKPRKAAYAVLRDPDSRETLDEGLALWFPAPASETGEDVVELHVHGGRAIVAAIYRVLEKIPEFRPAEAGEFTRRALLNGKLDLTAVESLGDLVIAETEAQRRQAMAQFRGALSKKVEIWRGRLMEAMARIEAAIDFSDEGDVPTNLLESAKTIARELIIEIEPVLADGPRGERLREGFTVAIAGLPNVGKSTLLNRLAEREVAIVSPIPGTTRDVIEVALDLKGVAVNLIDTAGIREAKDPVEAEGVRRAQARAKEADLVLWLVDNAQAGERTNAAREWIIQTKADLIDSDSQQRLKDKGLLFVSAKSGVGIDHLIERLSQMAEKLAGEPALVTHARQRHALGDAVARLYAALKIGNSTAREELFAEELRLAGRALGRVTGKYDVEDVLGEIFKNFCIGK
jgi:tRNA modification GTPase